MTLFDLINYFAESSDEEFPAPAGRAYGSVSDDCSDLDDEEGVGRVTFDNHVQVEKEEEEELPLVRLYSKPWRPNRLVDSDDSDDGLDAVLEERTEGKDAGCQSERAVKNGHLTMEVEERFLPSVQDKDKMAASKPQQSPLNAFPAFSCELSGQALESQRPFADIGLGESGVGRSLEPITHRVQEEGSDQLVQPVRDVDEDGAVEEGGRDGGTVGERLEQPPEEETAAAALKGGSVLLEDSTTDDSQELSFQWGQSLPLAQLPPASLCPSPSSSSGAAVGAGGQRNFSLHQDPLSTQDILGDGSQWQDTPSLVPQSQVADDETQYLDAEGYVCMKGCGLQRGVSLGV